MIPGLCQAGSDLPSRTDVERVEDKVPARSVKITIRNATKFSFTKLKGDDSTLCHGCFTDPFSFPPTISPCEAVTWFAESNFPATGTEGWVKYQVVPFKGQTLNDTILIYWDNPFVGNTFFGYQASSQNDLDPKKLWQADCGDDVHLVFEGQPSQFDFFAPYPAILNDQLVGLTQGDLDGKSGSTIVILPFPWQDQLYAHAWFDIGITDKTDSSMNLVCQSLSLDPKKGLRALAPGIHSFSLRQRLRT